MVVKKLAPSQIRYNQDSISNRFGDNIHHAGQYIGETLDEIIRDPSRANRIHRITVVKKHGKWFTLNNRRLWVFKKAEELGILSSINVNVKKRNKKLKFTTKCDGEYVLIRGGSCYGHLWRSLERQMIKENRDQQGGGNIIKSVIDWISSSIVCIFRYWTSPQ